MYLRVAAKTVAMAAIPITATVYAADTMDTGKDQSQDTAAVQVIAVDKIQKTAADEDNKVFRHQVSLNINFNIHQFYVYNLEIYFQVFVVIIFYDNV